MPNIYQRLKAFISPQSTTPSAKNLVNLNPFAQNENALPTATDKYGAAYVVARNEAAFACVSARMSAIGSAKWRVTTPSGVELANSEDAIPRHKFALAVKRLERETSANYFELYELALCVAGENFTELLRDKFTFAKGAGLSWLNPLSIQIDAPDGVNIRGYWYSNGAGSVRLEADRIAYDRNPLDLRTDVFGHSPLMSSSTTAQIVRSAGVLLAKYFENDATPNRVAMPDGTMMQMWSDEQVASIRRAVNANHKGVKNAFRMGIFPLPMQIQSYEPPELSQWVEMIKELESEIFLVYGVPRSIAGDSDSTRYQASPDDKARFNRTIRNELKTIARAVNAQVMPFFSDSAEDAVFEFDLSEYNEVNKEIASLVAQAYNDGVATTNEYRIAIGLKPLDAGDALKPPPPPVMLPPSTPPTNAPLDEPPEAERLNDERRKWYDVYRKHGVERALSFKTVHLPPTVAHDIRQALKSGDTGVFKRWRAVFADDVSHVPFPSELAPIKASLDALGYRLADDRKKSLLDDIVLDHLAQKSIGSTRLEFFEVTRKLFEDAIAGEVDKQNFVRRLTDAVENGVTRAYRDGMQVAGIQAPFLAPEDLRWVYTWMTTQRGYIDNVARAIYDDDQVTAKEAESKDELWYNHSIYPAYLQGLTKAGNALVFEWQLGNTEEHCRSCLSLNGQRRTMRTWQETIMPKASELECTGMRCDCSLEPMPKGTPPTNGDLPRWQYKRGE